MLAARPVLRPVSAPLRTRTAVVVRAAGEAKGKRADTTPALGKAHLVDEIAAATGLPKTQAAAAFDALVNEVVTAVAKGNRVTIQGFGSFEARQRAARTGVNPSTKEKIQIAATTAPAFKASTSFKDMVAGRVPVPSKAAAPAPPAPKAAAPKPPAAAPPAAAKKASIPPRSQPPPKK